MTPSPHAWIKEFPAAIIVCDTEGIVLEMNDRAAKNTEKDGGYELVGRNLFDCHTEAALAKMKDLMKSRRTNVYTTEKNGIKKMVYQSPWTLNGVYAGFVQISFEIPFEVPHHVRD